MRIKKLNRKKSKRQKKMPKKEMETKKEIEKIKEEPKEEKTVKSEPIEETVKKLGMEESGEKRSLGKRDEQIAGIAYVFGSFNNTIVHITDIGGNTIARITGGMVTKHSRLKANPTTAMFVAKRAAERARDVGVNALYIRTRGKTGSPGMGPGAHAAVKTLGKEGFKIISVLDATRMARGGPKKKGGKRGRRV
jgi:small subunit ribosomal protein S11